MVLGTFVESDLLFHRVYDARWALAAPIGQGLSLVVWVMVLSATIEPALYALGDSRSPAMVGLIRAFATALGMVLGFWLGGLWGFIAGLFCGMLCGRMAYFAALHRHDIRLVHQDLQYSAMLGAARGGLVQHGRATAS